MTEDTIHHSKAWKLRNSNYKMDILTRLSECCELMSFVNSDGELRLLTENNSENDHGCTDYSYWNIKTVKDHDEWVEYELNNFILKERESIEPQLHQLTSIWRDSPRYIIELYRLVDAELV